MKRTLLILLSFTLFLNSCKSTKKTIPTHSSTKQKLEKVYQKYKGVKYRYGGTTSRGFDCSGFVQRVYMDAFKISLPRTTKMMMKTGKRVTKDQLKIGDLVFFHPTRKYYHVGIYMGNGIFMHASTSKGVMKSKLDLKYWRRSYVKARRILKK
jgi:cell wall-associated NlpC family hydrolase